MRPNSAIGIGLAFCLTLAAAAWGHEGATGIVKERMDAMSAMAKAMKAVGDMIKGKTAFEATAVEPAAATLVQHARSIPTQFPDSDHSRSGKTDALPAVWSRWGDFEALAAQLERQASALGTLAAAGDRAAITRQFAETAKVCRDCHTDFRKPKD